MPSFSDSIFLFILALLLFGPKRLPVLARELGKWVGEFRRASNEFKMQMEEELRLTEQSDRQKQIAAMEAAAPVTPPIPESEPLELSASSSDEQTDAVPDTAISDTAVSDTAVSLGAEELTPDAMPQPTYEISGRCPDTASHCDLRRPQHYAAVNRPAHTAANLGAAQQCPARPAGCAPCCSRSTYRTCTCTGDNSAWQLILSTAPAPLSTTVQNFQA